MNEVTSAAAVLGRLGGKSKSPAKAAAARANGCKPKEKKRKLASLKNRLGRLRKVERPTPKQTLTVEQIQRQIEKLNK